MIRLLLFAFAGLLLGGIIHIVVVLMVPTYAPADAWTRIASVTEPEHFVELPASADDAAVIPMLDPMMRHVVCRYRLTVAPVRITATLPRSFWSVALFNTKGENVYSINNASVGSDILDMLVLTPDQLSQLRENPPENLEDMLVIEQTEQDGFALIRAFVPDASVAPEVEKGLKSARCGIETTF